jgi:hypothetical protein
MTIDQGLTGRKVRIAIAIAGPITCLLLFATVITADHFNAWDGFGFSIIGIPIVIVIHVMGTVLLIAIGISRGIIYRRLELSTTLGLLYYALSLALLFLHFNRATGVHH